MKIINNQVVAPLRVAILVSSRLKIVINGTVTGVGITEEYIQDLLFLKNHITLQLFLDPLVAKLQDVGWLMEIEEENIFRKEILIVMEDIVEHL